MKFLLMDKNNKHTRWSYNTKTQMHIGKNLIFLESDEKDMMYLYDFMVNNPTEQIVKIHHPTIDSNNLQSDLSRAKQNVLDGNKVIVVLYSSERVEGLKRVNKIRKMYDKFEDEIKKISEDVIVVDDISSLMGNISRLHKEYNLFV